MCREVFDPQLEISKILQIVIEGLQLESKSDVAEDMLDEQVSDNENDITITEEEEKHLLSYEENDSVFESSLYVTANETKASNLTINENDATRSNSTIDDAKDENDAIAKSDEMIGQKELICDLVAEKMEKLRETEEKVSSPEEIITDLLKEIVDNLEMSEKKSDWPVDEKSERSDFIQFDE